MLLVVKWCWAGGGVGAVMVRRGGGKTGCGRIGLGFTISRNEHVIVAFASHFTVGRAVLKENTCVLEKAGKEFRYLVFLFL